jgi:hypothetical protein
MRFSRPPGQWCWNEGNAQRVFDSLADCERLEEAEDLK